MNLENDCEPSKYHIITTSLENGEKVLRFDGVKQTALNLGESSGSQDVYRLAARIPFFFDSELKKVLLIGLGGGVVVHYLLALSPTIEITICEIDPAVVDIAYEEFALPKSSNIKVVVDDGRHFLEGQSEKYDYIFVDAYFSEGMPTTFVTREFFALLEKNLSSHGVAGYNIVANPAGQNYANFCATGLSIFQDVLSVAAGNDCRYSRTNIAAFFSKRVFDTTLLEAQLRENTDLVQSNSTKLLTKSDILSGQREKTANVFTDSVMVETLFFAPIDEIE